MLDLKRMGIDPGEISRSCSGASSVITKKVLLMKAVQELFEVSMTPTEFASIETVTELTEFICRHHLSACNTECSDDKQKTEAEGFDVYAIHQNGAGPDQCGHHPVPHLTGRRKALIHPGFLPSAQRSAQH